MLILYTQAGIMIGTACLFFKNISKYSINSIYIVIVDIVSRFFTHPYLNLYSKVEQNDSKLKTTKKTK